MGGVLRLCLLWLALAVPVQASDLPAHYRVNGVEAGDVLNIRAGPGVGFAVIGALMPLARQIEVVALSPDGRWGLLNSGEQSGWAAMRFLAREDGESWRSGARPLACFGTEPFWRVNLFLPSHRAEVFFPGEGGFELVLDTAPLPATAFPPSLAIPFSGAREGVAVLRGALCSDGMSDQSFGIEGQIYWRGDAQGLSGCCLLMR